ncbi:UDP-N-acetylmuramate dehydrogenase [bacterium]|nr:MAG: UDP-N-acetylmuramate dehydrogenase [bacterium]
MRTVIDRLRFSRFEGLLVEGEPMSRHCSLKVGGRAALLAVPDNMEELLMLLGTLRDSGVEWLIIGGGTNVMFAGKEYRGCVIRLGEGFRSTVVGENGKWEIGAACVTAKVLADTVQKGFSGLEFAAGIPGTMGGAVRMNAGTHEGDFSGICSEVQIVEEDQVHWVSREKMKFSYRKFEMSPGSVITGIRVTLTPEDPQLVVNGMERVQEKRKKTQPLGIPSAGCWFLNPEGDSAGRLIDAAGMKGERIGGAEVSDIHANFLVNRGEAKPEDFVALAARVKNIVYDTFGVDLEEEVQVVGG